MISHRVQLLTFKQGDGESLETALARFMHLATSRPPHIIQEEMLMQHFVHGLNVESEHFLNLASERSVMYKTVSEAKTILEKVLNSTPLTILLSQQIRPPKGSHSTSFPLFPLHLHHTLRKSPNRPSPQIMSHSLKNCLCSYQTSFQRKSTLNSVMFQTCRRNISAIAHDLKRSFPRPPPRSRVFLWL